MDSGLRVLCQILFFRWEMSSTVPSMLHGVVSTVVGFWLLHDHWNANGALVADMTNTVKDTALIQFSCVSQRLLSPADHA